ncbi:MAG TPA: hypothetical protein VGM69_10810 [Chloroflexota bacterium]|jgi:hypothetical protein
MKRRALVAFTLLALGLAPACASGTATPPDVPLAVAAESAPANPLSPKTVGAVEPAVPATVRALTPGATYRVGEAVRSGDLIVALLDGRTGTGVIEARFLIHNAGVEDAAVSAGNFRLQTAAGRPRMRLREPSEPLPIGRLGPGDTLYGTVSWDVPDAGAARVLFANGPDSVEWALAS